MRCSDSKGWTTFSLSSFLYFLCTSLGGVEGTVIISWVGHTGGSRRHYCFSLRLLWEWRGEAKKRSSKLKSKIKTSICAIYFRDFRLWLLGTTFGRFWMRNSMSVVCPTSLWELDDGEASVIYEFAAILWKANCCMLTTEHRYLEECTLLLLLLLLLTISDVGGLKLVYLMCIKCKFMVLRFKSYCNMLS